MLDAKYRMEHNHAIEWCYVMMKINISIYKTLYISNK